MGPHCAFHETISPNNEAAPQQNRLDLKVSRAVRKNFTAEIARQSGEIAPCRRAATIFYFDANIALPVC
ncbi:hypothetical protein [Donghicola mangrovi]|uniref:Uncharacterized protein n=1 Tax=Donghicola mangrovi TaxID=2729614 RepID=A0A850QC07_9RHOB|nr:hypothetical protein [Donghicola mangrovi]NVO24410.1 hypothetical protein [Donghicola mangrovi]